MAVTLTSTGIQFPNGSVQATDGSLKAAATTQSSASGMSSYTWTGLSDPKKIEINLWSASPSSGPPTQALTLGGTGGYSATVNGAHWSYGTTQGTYSNIANLAYYTNPYSFGAGTKWVIYKVYQDTSSGLYYFTHMAGSETGRWSHGQLTVLGSINSVTVTGGGYTFSNLTASINYE